MEIYKATNKINGESYIGLTTEGLEIRKPKHKSSSKRGSNYYFHKALRKYGFDNFNWMVIEHEVSDLDILKVLEIYWIEEFDTKVPNGYNLTDGGEGSKGIKRSDEAKKKMSESHKGKVLSEETKKKISEANNGEKAYWFGKKLSVESIKKRTETRRKNGGYIVSEETRYKKSIVLKGKKSPMKGRHHSEETKRKISETLTSRRRQNYENNISNDSIQC